MIIADINNIARIHGGLGCGCPGAEIGVPCVITGALDLRKGLTMRVGAGQATEVSASPDGLAGDEKCRH